MKHSFDEHDGVTEPTKTPRTDEAYILRLLGRIADLEREFAQAQQRVAELEARLNTPEIEDFSRAVCLEAAHQIERWGTAHDRAKSAEHWYWLVGYLAGKALRATITGDRDKALHHCISSAAALAHWHDAIRLDKSGAGVGQDQDLDPSEVKR